MFWMWVEWYRSISFSSYVWWYKTNSNMWEILQQIFNTWMTVYITMYNLLYSKYMQGVWNQFGFGNISEDNIWIFIQNLVLKMVKKLFWKKWKIWRIVENRKDVFIETIKMETMLPALADLDDNYLSRNLSPAGVWISICLAIFRDLQKQVW